jgi:HSP20 family protein
MLIQYDPFEVWDRFLEQVLAGDATPRRVPIDAIRRGDCVEMSCELPGVDPESIVVAVDDDVLAIRAVRVVAAEAGDEVLELERAQGVFGRDVALSPTLDASRVDTRYEAGILRITIPVADPIAAELVDGLGAAARPGLRNPTRGRGRSVG